MYFGANDLQCEAVILPVFFLMLCQIYSSKWRHTPFHSVWWVLVRNQEPKRKTWPTVNWRQYREIICFLRCKYRSFIQSQCLEKVVWILALVCLVLFIFKPWIVHFPLPIPILSLHPIHPKPLRFVMHILVTRPFPSCSLPVILFCVKSSLMFCSLLGSWTSFLLTHNTMSTLWKMFSNFYMVHIKAAEQLHSWIWSVYVCLHISLWPQGQWSESGGLHQAISSIYP